MNAKDASMRPFTLECTNIIVCVVDFKQTAQECDTPFFVQVVIMVDETTHGNIYSHIVYTGSATFPTLVIMETP